MKRRGRFTLAAVALAILLVAAVVGPARVPGWGGDLPQLALPDEAPREAPPAPRADVLVAVRAGADGTPIDPRVYSFNYASWAYPLDHGPVADATFVAMVKQLRPAMLRWPAGHWSQSMCWELPGAPPCAPAHQHVMTEEDLRAHLALTDAVGAQPLLGVNVKTGSPEQAAAVARWMVADGRAGAWYELGNEPDLHGGRGTTPQAQAEAARRFAAAIRAVDPQARIVAGVVMTGAHVAPWSGQPDWMGPLAAGVGREADAYSWHWYPLDSDNRRATSAAHPTVEHLLAENAWDWRPSGLDFAESACARMEAIRNATGAEHWVTELGPDSGAVQAPGITDGQVAAVWMADALPRLAECGADAVFQFALRQPKGSHLVLMRNDRTPTPMWATYQLLSQNWRGHALPAEHDTRNHTLAVHAARTGEGDLAVVVVNKGATNLTAALRWDGAYPLGATCWTIEADGPTATTNRVNGANFTQEVAIAGPAGVECDPWAAIEVPAYGVVVLRASPPRG